MSTLDRLAGPGGVLGKEAPDAKEFDGLVRSGLARLRDAEKQENSLESRFDLAYGAAHALCLAALPAVQSAPVLFRQLLLWGVAMTLVGALLCQIFAGPFARA